MKLVKRRCQCLNCIPFLRKFMKYNPKPQEEKTLLEIESEKPPLGNFTLSEYTEKCIMYGLMMVRGNFSILLMNHLSDLLVSIYTVFNITSVILLLPVHSCFPEVSCTSSVALERKIVLVLV